MFNLWDSTSDRSFRRSSRPDLSRSSTSLCSSTCSRPGPGAIPPATQDDAALQRDYQTKNLFVSVAGPVIRLSKSVSSPGVRPYELLTYTIAYTNVGGAAAFNLQVQDILPTWTTNVTNSLAISLNGAAFNSMSGAVDADNAEFTSVAGKAAVRFRPNGGTVNAGEYGALRFSVRVK